jgi:uncharacterized protein (TIGR02594 family)
MKMENLQLIMNQVMSEILKIAFSQLGTKEIKGPKHNLTIVKYAHEIGINWINDDETPWCGVFPNWVLKKAGLKYLSSAVARDALKLGLPVSDPKPGDLVIYWRESIESYKGHLGFFLGYSQSGEIFTLGGNQSNMVSIAPYSANMVLGFRRVEFNEMTFIPDSPIVFGDTGNHVQQLQKLLNLYPDGIYGARTSAGVNELQKKAGLEVTGYYDIDTQIYLTSKLQS